MKENIQENLKVTETVEEINAVCTKVRLNTQGN
jgi:hypothetical protein